MRCIESDVPVTFLSLPKFDINPAFGRHNASSMASRWVTWRHPSPGLRPVVVPKPTACALTLGWSLTSKPPHSIPWLTLFCCRFIVVDMGKLSANLVAQVQLPGVVFEVIPINLNGSIHYVAIRELNFAPSGFSDGFPWGTLEDPLIVNRRFCAPLLILATNSKGQWIRLHPLTNETPPYAPEGHTRWPHWSPWNYFHSCWIVQLQHGQLVPAAPLFAGAVALEPAPGLIGAQTAVGNSVVVYI